MVGGQRIRGWSFGGDGWDVPISVACILACFIAKAADVVNGRAGVAMVGGASVFVVGFGGNG